MSKDFRWVGPGILKEVFDDVVTIHAPGALVKGHSLPDKRVDEFLKMGCAELFKIGGDGQVISLNVDGIGLPQATPVDSISAEELARVEEEAQRNHDDAGAIQKLAAARSAPVAPAIQKLAAARSAPVAPVATVVPAPVVPPVVVVEGNEPNLDNAADPKDPK